MVVLAGGGVGSPRLLHASGLGPHSSAFFSDPVVAVMGSVDGLDGGAEVPMAAGMRFGEQGIWLADMTLPKPMYQAFTAQAGRFDRLFAHRQTLSIMVKIGDAIGGGVGPKWVDKPLRQADRDKLASGVGMARRCRGARSRAAASASRTGTRTKSTSRPTACPAIATISRSGSGSGPPRS